MRRRGVFGKGDGILLAMREGKGGQTWSSVILSIAEDLPYSDLQCDKTGIIPLSIDLRTWRLYIGRRSSLRGEEERRSMLVYPQVAVMLLWDPYYSLGSSADRICSCMKNALGFSHLGQGVSVESTFFQLSSPPITSSTSFLRSWVLLVICFVIGK